MKKLIFYISLTVQGPLLSKSSAPGSYGLDAVMARDHLNKPVIHSSHIFGKLLDAWEDLDQSGQVQAHGLVGKVNDKGDYAPMRKRFQFTDFTLCGSPDSGVRNRIRVDESRKSVTKGALRFAEDLFLPGGHYTFTGSCTCMVRDDAEAERLRIFLKAGLKYIPQLGGERSVGLGRMVRVQMSSEIIPFPGPDNSCLFPGGLGLVIKPCSPFIFAGKRLADNLFESSDRIPGAAIAGTIALLWREMTGKKNTPFNKNFDPLRPDLGQWFNKLCFLNALPGTTPNKRPVQWPHSLVRDQDKKLWDIVRHKDAVLVNDNAPTFFVDWKQKEDVQKEFGWAVPNRELRVRTAINRKELRATDTELFAYEMIVPESTNWYSKVLFPEDMDVDQCARVADQLASLFKPGIFGLGKTKAEADVEIVPADQIEDYHPSGSVNLDCGKLCFLTLQSPAILCDPNKLKGKQSPGKLLTVYQEAWKDLSNNTIELSHFFASQTLAGGNYLWKRFQSDKNYFPWLLTDGGSVFALRAVTGKEKEAAGYIRRWLQQGLDIPSWAKERYQNTKINRFGDHWKTCPFLPQLGYGECRVNLSLHADSAKRAKTKPIPQIKSEEK